MQMDDIQSWWEVPSIAHFCSLFRAAFDLLDYDIEVCELEEALLTDGTEDSGNSLLQELIVRLLNGCYRHHDISTFNYQMFLRRLFRKKCQEYGRDNPFNTDMDFQFLPLRTKVEILHALCDFRLDADDVQDLLKHLEADSLRVEPLGHDENNSAYWYFYGTRLYREDYPRSRRKTKEKRKRGKEEKRRKKHKHPMMHLNSEEKGTWQVVCYTEEDWDRIAASFKGSRCKAEKSLYHTLKDDFLPEIPRLFAEKERLQRKRMLEYQPRRQSSRLEKLKQMKEEEVNLQKQTEKKVKEHHTHESEYEKKDKKRRSRSTKENKINHIHKKSRYGTNSRTNSESGSIASLSDGKSGQSTTFVGRQTNNSLSSATGQIVIQGLRRKLRSSQVFRQTEEDLQTGMYKILEYIKNHEDAWPFLEPVDEEYAPRYYSIILKPMDLQRMEDKLDEGEYMSSCEFKSDFQLIVDNCRKYNGTDNEYTEMVGNLQHAFQLAVDRYLESESSSDEEIAVEFSDKIPEKPPIPRPPVRKKKEIIIEEEPILSPSPPPSIESSPSSDEDEKAPDSEKEPEEKSDTPPDAADSDSSSTKDDAEIKSIPSHSGSKRKKKNGPKNAPDIEALELATEQTLKDNSKRRSNKDLTKQMRRREIQRTIERLQPGKSKGNLISNIQNGSKVSEEGQPGKPKDTRSSLLTVVDEATPKLSLGTVLGTDVLGFGVGQHKHNFDSKTKEIEKTELVPEEPPKPIMITRPKTPEAPLEIENKEELPESKVKEEVEIKAVNKDYRQEKAMPNLSAWFKAFGAPKSSSGAKKRLDSFQDGSSVDIMNPEERRDFALESVSDRNIVFETPSVIVHDVRQPVMVETKLEESDTRRFLQRKDSRDDLSSPVPLNSNHSVVPRQRRLSTGSTVSERSSFSQDMIDPVDGSSPRLSLDEHLASYSAPYSSPLNQSSVISSPRPEEEPNYTSYPPINGTIRVGFYQDTSFSAQKNSPEKMNQSPKESPCSPFSTYTPRMYPPHDPGGFVNYQNQPSSPSTTVSEASYENASYANPLMTYYDTSKPLTDQYRAARTQESDVYSSDSLTTGVVSNLTTSNCSSPLPTDERKSPATSVVMAKFTPPSVVPTPTHSTVGPRLSATVFPVKKRLYSEIEMSNSTQTSNRYPSLPGTPPPAHSQSANRMLPPESAMIIENAHQNRHIRSTFDYSDKIVTPSSEKIYPSRKSNINEHIHKRSEHTVQHVSKKHQSIRIHQSSGNGVESVEKYQRSPPEIMEEYTNEHILVHHSNPPLLKDSMALTPPTFVPRANAIKRHGIKDNPNNISSDDDDDCKVIKIQHTNVPVITSSRTSNRQSHQEMLGKMEQQQNSEKIQVIKTVNNMPSSSDGSSESILSGRSHLTKISSTSSNASENLKTGSNGPLHASDLSFHRGPFSPVPPSSVGMDHLALHANLSNLSHAVDRFPSNERVLSGLPSPSSPYFGEKGVSPPYMYRQNISSTLPSSESSTSPSNMGLLPQPSPPAMTNTYNHENRLSPTITFNRSVSELPNKVPNIQAAYGQSVQDLSTMLPTKNCSPISVIPVSELTSINASKSSPTLNARTGYRSVNELSSVLSTKGTTPVNLKSYNQSVTDLSTTLPNKVAVSPSVETASYGRSATDYSLLSGKTSDTQSTPKPSRKRKSKQVVVPTNEASSVATSSSATAFQQYVGLNNTTNVSESLPIALKSATVLSGSAFNFGPAHAGLGLYGAEKDGYTGYLEDYRAAPSSYYIPAPEPGHDKINAASHPSAPAPTLPFSFTGHSRSPSYALAQAFINQSGLVDPAGTSSPLYQQYLHRHPEDLLRHTGTPMVLHQGLLAPPPSSYTTGYHPALGIRQPYDALNRPTWL